MRNLLILLLITISCQSQVVVKYDAFVSDFDTIRNYPTKVSYTTTREDLICNKSFRRKNNFHGSSSVRRNDLTWYYSNSGYDRGHMMPADNNRCDWSEMNDCFSYVNISPQHPNLNRGVWKSLELYERSIAKRYGSVDVECGNYGILKRVKQLSIPTHCWKILRYRDRVECYWFPNKDGVSSRYFKYYRVTEIQLKYNLNENK